MDNRFIEDEDTAAPDDLRDSSPSARIREETLRKIKLALLTTGELQLAPDERARGVNPYDSQLGSRPRDVWKGRRRA